MQSSSSGNLRHQSSETAAKNAFETCYPPYTKHPRPFGYNKTSAQSESAVLATIQCQEGWDTVHDRPHPGATPLPEDCVNHRAPKRVPKPEGIARLRQSLPLATYSPVATATPQIYPSNLHRPSTHHYRRSSPRQSSW